MYKILCMMWGICAFLNLIAFFTRGFDFDKIIIVLLEGLLACHNYNEYKRTGT